MQNETVVVDERQGIGGQIIQVRILKAQRWLDLTASLLLAKEVGDVIGAKRAGGMSFAESGRYQIRPIFPNQHK